MREGTNERTYTTTKYITTLLLCSRVKMEKKVKKSVLIGKNFRKLEKIFSNIAWPLMQNKTQFFHPYCAWGEPFLRLALLWSTNTRWIGLRQPLRHAARRGALSTLAEERLPCRASACLCLKCIPGFTLHLPKSRVLKATKPYTWQHCIDVPTCFSSRVFFSANDWKRRTRHNFEERVFVAV